MDANINILMKKIVLSGLLIILFTFTTFARKAVDRIIQFKQPDGTEIPIKLYGDAFFHYKTLSNGSIVLEDKQGWLCYAYFNSDGHLINSGIRIQQDAPAELTAKSKLKPKGLMNKRRAERFRHINYSYKPMGIGIKAEEGNPPQRNALVILAQYKDIKFRYQKEDFVKMLTQKGYSLFGAQGCAAEYFDAQFSGKYNFHFDVSEIVTLPENRSWYGNDIGTPPNTEDKNPEQMIADACKLADDEIDFSIYDADGDGVVDNVFVFFAGDDEAETGKEECIWSHAYYIYSGKAKIDLVLDGTRIDRYACTSEMTYRKKTSGYVPELAGIGTFCHEYTHTFGLPDLYDTDYDGSGGTSKALWKTTSLMDSGNHNNEGNTPPYYNAIEREMLGLSKPIEIKESGTYTLEPIHIQGSCYRINTLDANEYFLLECRYPEGWDKYCGGQGLLIYHIDKSDRPAGFSDSYGKTLSAKERWGFTNEVNCRPDHECAKIIAAFKDSEDASGIFYPQKDKNSVYTSDLKFWEGGESGVSLSNIRFEGKNIVFDAVIKENTLAPIKLNSKTFNNSARILFESQTPVEKAKLVLSKSGESDKIIVEAKPYEDKKFSVKIEGLKPATRYIVNISLDDGSMQEEPLVTSLTIQTQNYSKLSHIAIMEAYDRNSDGSLNHGAKIALEVISKEKPEKVIWSYNGTEITEGIDNFYHPTHSGTLEAEIHYKDGTKEKIKKDIRLQ